MIPPLFPAVPAQIKWSLKFVQIARRQKPVFVSRVTLIQILPNRDQYLVHLVAQEEFQVLVELLVSNVQQESIQKQKNAYAKVHLP